MLGAEGVGGEEKREKKRETYRMTKWPDRTFKLTLFDPIMYMPEVCKNKGMSEGKEEDGGGEEERERGRGGENESHSP